MSATSEDKGTSLEGRVRRAANMVVRDTVADYEIAGFLAHRKEVRLRLLEEMRSVSQETLGIFISNIDIGEVVFPPSGLESSEIPSTQKVKSEKTDLSSNRVFLVHGRDSIKEEVARFLMKLQLDPVILEEQPSRGRTIIEKFEEYANVRYAIVLLTPDDIGAVAGTLPILKERARQNVIFELGYFIRGLGRTHVCVIHKSTLDIPSDYGVVIYIPWEGNWEKLLMRELKSAGFSIDANRSLGDV